MINRKRKEELLDLLRSWRTLTAKGASTELTCEELKFLYEEEANRPSYSPSRPVVLERLKRMINTRCWDEDSEGNS